MSTPSSPLSESNSSQPLYYSPEKSTSNTPSFSPVIERMGALFSTREASNNSHRNLFGSSSVSACSGSISSESNRQSGVATNRNRSYTSYSSISSSIETTDLLFPTTPPKATKLSPGKRHEGRPKTPDSQKKQRLSPSPAISSSSLHSTSHSLLQSVPYSAFFASGDSSSDSESSSAPSTPKKDVKGNTIFTKGPVTPQKIRQLMKQTTSDEITYRHARGEDIVLISEALQTVQSHPREEELLQNLTRNTLTTLEVPFRECHQSPSKMRPQTHQTLYQASSLALLSLNFSSTFAIFNPEHIVAGDETGGGHARLTASSTKVDSSQGISGQMVTRPRRKFSSIFPGSDIAKYLNRSLTISRLGCVQLKIYSSTASIVYDCIKNTSTLSATIERRTGPLTNTTLKVSYLIAQYYTSKPDFYLEAIITTSPRENVLVSTHNDCIEARMSPKKIRMVQEKSKQIEMIKTTYPIFYYQKFTEKRTYQIEKEGRVYTRQEIFRAIHSTVDKAYNRRESREGYNPIRHKVSGDYVVDIAPELFPGINVPRGIYMQINTKNLPKLRAKLQSLR